MNVTATATMGAPGAAPMPANKPSAGGFDRVLSEATAVTFKDDPKKIANAARQFEGLMVGQLLKAAHGPDSDGWMGAGDDDDSSSTAIQMAEEYLGQAIANGGGLGISKMIVQGLERGSATSSSSSQMPQNPQPSHRDSAK